MADIKKLAEELVNLTVKEVTELAAILKDEYGVTMAVHPHGDSHIENKGQIERFFAETDPEYVSFCLDTGHLEYGEVDTVELIRNYPDRIAIGIDARDGEVSVDGWTQGSGLAALDFARLMAAAGARLAVYTDISRDGMLAGAATDAVRTMVTSSGLSIIASNSTAFRSPRTKADACRGQ